MKTSLRLSFCILGAVIGAGFATAKEISTFFACYGHLGFFGVVISSLLLGIYIFFVMNKISRQSIKTPFEYIKSISNTPFAYFSMTVTYFLMFSFYCIMIAGCGEILNEVFLVPKIYAALGVSVFCCIVFLYGNEAILNVSSVLTPVMIFGMIALSVLSIREKEAFCIFKNSDNFITSSFLYVSYNTLGILALICEMSPYYKSKKTVVFATSAITSFAGFSIMLLLWWMLYINPPIFMSYNMPALHIARKFGKTFEVFYVFVVFFAMITTALSSGFALVMPSGKKKKKRNLCLMCIISSVMTLFGFSKLIDSLYPFFGYLGMSVFVLVVFDFVRNTKKNVKKLR